MSSIATFTSDKWPLSTFLDKVQELELQLPDFQRGWIWDDDHLRSLLASISQSYPIGTVMMLAGGNPEVVFRPRPVEGVPEQPEQDPKWLLLDGQQRLTSLYLALMSGAAVNTTDVRGKPIKRWYYVDIRLALDPDIDREDSIVGLPEERIIRDFRREVIADYSSPEREYQHCMFPLAQVGDSSDWRMGFEQYWDHDKEFVKLWNSFEREVVKRFEQYLLPFILLDAATPRNAVCQIFEKVNTGGVALTVFELLTATFAAENFSLRDDWVVREKRLRKMPQLSELASTDFLQAVTLLATHRRRQDVLGSAVQLDKAPPIGCKRKDVLRLKLFDYKRFADQAVEGFEAAARLLQSQKIFAFRDVPYRTQIVPLATSMALLGKRAENDGVRRQLTRWYWCGVFGELYGSAVESRFARDVAEIVPWIDGGSEPITITEASFSAERLGRLRSRQSAAYKGLYAILMRDGGLDFRTADPIEVQVYFDDKIDIHHIFPQLWCGEHKIAPGRCDSIINKTAISARTNRMIGGKAPSIYLPKVEAWAGIDEQRMDAILSSHAINATLLRSDDFDRYFAERESALLDRVEAAMGKPVQRQVSSEEADLEPDEFEVEQVA